MPDGIGYLTPDYDGNASVECLTLALPSYLWRFVHGALGELTEASNWVPFGNLSPDDMVSLFIDALDEMRPCMIGQIVTFTTLNLPDNVLLCDGSQFNPLLFPRLYDHLQSDTVPDLRGRFILGHGNGRVPGDVGGAETHTLTIGEMPTHSHGYTAALPSVTTIVIPDEPSAVPGPSTTAPEGGNQPHNNMPPFITLVYGIVAK